MTVCHQGDRRYQLFWTVCQTLGFCGISCFSDFCAFEYLCVCYVFLYPGRPFNLLIKSDVHEPTTAHIPLVVEDSTSYSNTSRIVILWWLYLNYKQSIQQIHLEQILRRNFCFMTIYLWSWLCLVLTEHPITLECIDIWIAMSRCIDQQ